MTLPKTVVTLLVLAGLASAQDPDFEKTEDTYEGGAPASAPPALPEGMSVEQMWPPPTEEDWQKPVLIDFERTWGDAVAVAREGWTRRGPREASWSPVG